MEKLKEIEKKVFSLGLGGTLPEIDPDGDFDWLIARIKALEAWQNWIDTHMDYNELKHLEGWGRLNFIELVEGAIELDRQLEPKGYGRETGK